MRTLKNPFLVPGLTAMLLAACSGGGSDASTVLVRCGTGEPFCVVSCDLGCTQTGCSITEIAENQKLFFRFSQRIDPASVNGSSFSIRTAGGQAPDGDLVVDGDTIRFQPRVRVRGGVSSFGFQRNETYLLTLAGGPSATQSIRSVSGLRLPREFSCTVVASRGIVDEDGQPPSAVLVAPTNLTDTPVDATIVLRFTELIDATPLAGALNSSTPIRYLLRRARAAGSTFECDTASNPIQIEGIPRVTVERVADKDVTVVSLKPNYDLPPRSCIEVAVTSDLRDLSGKQATPSTFRFITAAGTIAERNYDEAFETGARLDTTISSGRWEMGARPGRIGSDGRHGSFDYRLGTQVAAATFEWNTDDFVIPAGLSLDGREYRVTDGKFYFTDFTVPEGVVVRFTGTAPAQIFVRGRADISGRVESNGRAIGTFQARSRTLPSIAGQPGSLGGAGGGRGGRGGDRCTGLGPTIVSGVNQNNGFPGEDVRLQAGHAYLLQAAGTGGLGSPLYPAAGTNASLVGSYTVAFAFSGLLGLGGGGGGLSSPGSSASLTPFAGVNPGSGGTPGIGFNVLPFPPPSPPAGYSSLSHFLVGGSGGGGGGSHAFLALNGSTTNEWKAGGGGTGGGGAVAIRAGGDLVVRSTGVLQAKGGDGFTYNADDPNTPTQEQASAPDNWGVPSPGGGGSGGSFLLQSGALLTLDGRIDTTGGTGSRTGNIQPTTMNVLSQGGNGSAGTYRLEALTNVLVGAGVSVPAYNPALNRGDLVDADDLTGCASLWRSSGQLFPPTWLRYVLEVDVFGNGSDVRVYSDDPAFTSIGPASDPLLPVSVKFQGAMISSTTNLPLPNTTGAWRTAVSENRPDNINLDAPNGFRFMLTFNRRDFPNCVVRSLRVVSRG